VSYKRSASIELGNSVKRAPAPPVYEGASIRELQDILLNYEVYFEAIEARKNQDGKVKISCETPAPRRRKAWQPHVRVEIKRHLRLAGVKHGSPMSGWRSRDTYALSA
jgi:hypothetical protein